MAQTSTDAVHSASGKGMTIVLWTLQILAAVAFLGAGMAKFSGDAAMVAAFDKLGFGQWFRYLTGLLEIVGAAGLLVPRCTFYAAAMLATVMVGAVISHLAVLGGSPVAAIVLLALTAALAYFRRPVDRKR